MSHAGGKKPDPRSGKVKFQGQETLKVGNCSVFNNKVWGVDHWSHSGLIFKNLISKNNFIY